jgi:hypothetical protein
MTSVRAVAHVHSTWSYDGMWQLGDLARAFARRGFKVVLTAEHDVGFDDRRWRDYRSACADLSGPEMLVVPGIEYSDADNQTHVMVWGELPFLGEGADTLSVLQRVRELAGVAVLAHPWRRDVWATINPAWLPLLDGVEFWNRKYDGWAPNRRTKDALEQVPRAIPFVGLDFHTARQFFPLAMRIDVEGDIGERTVLNALRAGRCRADALGLPALRLVGGVPGRVARGAEVARGRLASWQRGAEKRHPTFGSWSRRALERGGSAASQASAPPESR